MDCFNDLGKRMKEYEERNRMYLQRRIPVLIRVDMRAGHTFLRGFATPFDDVFMKSMQETAKYLCENIQNCKLSYQQSDEITLLLVDYDKLNTDYTSTVWRNFNLQDTNQWYPILLLTQN